MTFRPTRLASAAAVAAALSMVATPAAAVDLPSPAMPASAYTQVNTGDAGEADGWRRYRRHRDRGIDAGDVIAGVVVVGALAALLSSTNNRSRDRYEERRVRYDDRRDRGYESRGIEGAVDMCVDQVEYRDNRVENVDRADRSASGWTVAGTLSDGERWTCFIDNSGDVRSIDYGRAAYRSGAVQSSGAQLSDADYARARAATRTPADTAYTYDDAALVDVPGADDPRPAYPGGPLPGEEGYDADWQVDGDLDGEWQDDGRYTTAQAADFEQPVR